MYYITFPLNFAYNFGVFSFIFIFSKLFNLKLDFLFVFFKETAISL